MTIEGPDQALVRALFWACVHQIPFPISSIPGGPPMADAYIDAINIEHDWQPVTTYGSTKKEWLHTGWTVSLDFREA